MEKIRLSDMAGPEIIRLVGGAAGRLIGSEIEQPSTMLIISVFRSTSMLMRLTLQYTIAKDLPRRDEEPPLRRGEH